MRLLDGRTLARVLATDSPPEIEFVLDVFAEIANAMDYAHREGVVHRDLKPGNVFLDHDVHPYVLDFGLAKMRELSSDSAGANLKGTLAYMSPEQLLGEPVDGLSDVFSLGTMLYEALTGRHPFAGSSTMTSILYKEPVSARTHRPEIPTALDTVLRRALTKKRSRRYGSMSELEGDLRTV